MLRFEPFLAPGGIRLLALFASQPAVVRGGAQGVQELPEVVREPSKDAVGDGAGDAAVVGFGDPAGDAGQRVAVAAERDGLADGVLEVRRVQEADDCLRDGPLTAVLPSVDGMPEGPGLVQVVAVFLFDVSTDCLFRLAPARQPDGGRRRLRAFDALGVVVGDLGRYLGQRQCLVESFSIIPHRTHAHC